LASYPALELRFAPGPGAGTLQDMLYAELDGFEPVAIHEHDAGDGWRVFFRTAAQRDGARSALASEFGNALDVQAVDVDDDDWARRSQAALKAVRAGRIIVAPPWDIPGADAPDIVIVIDPSTGFGTGHHATTRLCLELLQDLNMRGKRVIDVGTGSGILAIAAWKLGARDVIAIDTDADALQNARENIERNGATGAIQMSEADLGSVELAPADVVLANLTSAMLRRFAGSLKGLLAPGGTFILSGFSPADVDDIVRVLGATPARILTDEEWTAVSLSLLPPPSR
jgi:ribosomal protein L11 methyltransferase